VLIDEFLAQSRSNPMLAIPTSLEISGGLAQIFFMGREQAEAEGVEYGSSLFWMGKRLVSDEPIRGTQESTPLDTQQNSQIPQYAGNWHVHPYKQRMSNTVSIGPSTADLNIWLNLQQNGRVLPIRLHFVIAGPKLWLVVMYPWTDPDPALANGVNTDISQVQAWLYGDENRFELWHSAVHRINDATTLQNKIITDRLMNDALPGHAAIFAGASLQMNRNLARRHQYGLYIGEFGNRNTGTQHQPIHLFQQQ